VPQCVTWPWGSFLPLRTGMVQVAQHNDPHAAVCASGVAQSYRLLAAVKREQTDITITIVHVSDQLQVSLGVGTLSSVGAAFPSRQEPLGTAACLLLELGLKLAASQARGGHGARRRSRALPGPPVCASSVSGAPPGGLRRETR